MKKILFLIGLGLISIVVLGLGGQSAKAATDYGSQFFTHVELQDKNGVPDTDFKENERVKVVYNWNVTQVVHSGETMTLPLPVQLKYVSFAPFLLKDSGGNTVATALVDPISGKIILTFTTFVDTHSDIQGSMFFYADFNKANIVVDQINPIAFPVAGDLTTLGVMIRKVDSGGGTGTPTVVFKQGRIDANDSSLINWTVTLNNALVDINSAYYTDVMGPGQTLVGKVKLKYRDADKKELYTQNENITLDANRSFRLDLGDLIDTSVVITYQTKMAGGQFSYKNTAKIGGSNIEEQTRNATVNDYSGGGEGGGTTPPPVNPPTTNPEPPTPEKPNVDSITVTPNEPEVTTITDENNEIQIYIVKKGDTLSSVATKFETTPHQLRVWNKLKTDELKIGQKLIVKVTPKKETTRVMNTSSLTSPTMETLPQTGDVSHGIAELIGTLLAVSSATFLIRKK
ncbi:collagen binding domain-containing protein [Listeria grandensis]|uniref:collagen binding domain-containing protein n=1 Tax=Listeria grandensis TaxID=1494963 RepID=UPI00164E43D9|nr:LysM peptidoglycan-binding domain-containing protein [Listeria grandensis]MBC6314247.1 LysM peptidoglycan-binding domain-containing protein [Listeria grandensis]